MSRPMPWNIGKVKVELRLSVQRIRLLAAKKTQMAKVARREIASTLEQGRLEAAKIKVEAAINEDLLIEVLEILELYCETLLARIGVVDSVRELDPSVSDAVAAIVYTAPRLELRELSVLREQLIARYGRETATAIIENHNGIVPQRITNKLHVAPPSAELVDAYLRHIADAYNVNRDGTEAKAVESTDEPEKPESDSLAARFARVKQL